MRGEGDRAGPASAARRAPNASSPAEIGPSAIFFGRPVAAPVSRQGSRPATACK